MRMLRTLRAAARLHRALRQICGVSCFEPRQTPLPWRAALIRQGQEFVLGSEVPSVQAVYRQGIDVSATVGRELLEVVKRPIQRPKPDPRSF
jgi:hypothetical protein